MNKEETMVLINKLIKETVDKINNSNATSFSPLQKDIILSNYYTENNKEINIILSKLLSYYNEILPFVKNIRKNIHTITEQTHICASYLILQQSFQNWNSIFLLSKHGMSPGILCLLRTIKEGLDLICLFSMESHKQEAHYLHRWFAGEIIEHGKYRSELEKFYTNENFFNIENITNSSDLKINATSIYKIDSLAVHNAYLPLVQNISPFTQDYDTEITSYIRTLSALKYAAESMNQTTITLKTIYRFILNDREKYIQLSDILTKYIF